MDAPDPRPLEPAEAHSAPSHRSPAPEPSRPATPPPPHIVHVITRLLQGGAEENTVSTCLYQAARGSRVTLIHGLESHPSWAARLDGAVTQVAVPALRQAIHPVRDAAAIRDLARLFKSLRPDVVHTHQSKAGFLGRMAAARARVPSIVHTVHIAPFVNVRGPRRWAYAAAERWCALRTDLFIAVSEGMRDAYRQAGIGVGRRFEVIHSGMPLAKFVSATPPADWKRRIGGWDGAERPTIIVMLAAFEPRKRQRALLAAIAPALRARPDLCLLLAGEGSERALCERAADELGIARQVRFLGHDPAPQELIALADVCLLTSEREGLPRSVVQYIAGGKPVILSRLPGIEELIVDGVNGIITDPDDLGDAVARLLRLVDDRADLARLATGARATDVSRWREEAMGARIEAAYQRALRPRRVDRIEFFGLPGSGKTTIARHVVALLGDDDGDVLFSGHLMGDELGPWHRALRRLAMIATTLPRHGGSALGAARGLIGLPAGPRDVVKSLWNYASVVAMGLKHRRGGHGLLVMDQGIVQAMWSARMHGGAKRSAPVSLVAGDDVERTLFVRVDTAVEAARARLLRRPGRTSRMQRPDRIDEVSLWCRGEEIVADLTSEIEAALEHRSLGSRLLWLRGDGGDDPLALAQAIVAELKRAERVPSVDLVRDGELIDRSA